jgi:cobalt-zinc-cadmium efflux system outer membrane protein
MRFKRFSSSIALCVSLLFAFAISPPSSGIGAETPTLNAEREKSLPDKFEREPVAKDGVLTLQQAISLALAHNPELKASSWEVRALEGRVFQAGRLPNPEIAVETENFGGSGDLAGFDAAETTVQLSQLIELAGKRPKRQKLSALERDVAGRDYTVKRADVLARVTLAFVDVLSAQERQALMEELLHLAEEGFNSTAERVKAGKVSPVEEIKAKVALSSAQIDLKQAGYELKGSWSRLSETWGGTTPTFQKAQGDIDSVLPVPPFEELEGLVFQNPDIARWAAAIDQHRAGVELEEAKGIPDLRVSLGTKYHHESDDRAFIVGVSIPLPIFDRNRGGVLEARNQLSKTQEESKAARSRIINTLGERYQALSSAFAEITALQSDVLPGAQTAFEASREGYRYGKFTYLDMLDAQRTLIAVKLRYINALTTYHKAVTEVERLIGKKMPELINAQEKEKRP